MKERRRIENRLDALLRQIVISRDGKCVVCGTTTDVLQCGHLISRGKKSVKYDLRNVACQCRSCNGRHRFEPQHYFNWFIKQYGQEEFEALVLKSKQTKKYTIAELEDIEIALKEILIRQYE